MSIEQAHESEVLSKGTPMEALHRMVADGAMSVLSFDVFDTLLWRRVPEPADLFEVLGQDLLDRGWLVDWVSPRGFRQLRERAEQRARDGRGDLGPEVSLHEIWDEMPLEVFTVGSRSELVGAEMRLEREYTVVDIATASLLETATKAGVRVVLVSDTYFTAEQLTYLLDRPELPLPADVRIFRSNAYGVPKGGGLFSSVLTELGVEPVEVLHLGDNPVADGEAPRELGIRTVSYERIDDDFAEILARENPDRGDGADGGLTTLRARAVTHAGPSSSRVGAARRWGVGVLGPVLTGFAEYIAETAAARGVEIVWCPMREGELLSELVNSAAAARNLSVEARPLWLSRHVVWLATIDRIDAAAIQDLVERVFRPTVRAVLGFVGLNPGEVPALAARLDEVVVDEQFAAAVAATLCETPYLRHRMAVHATARRRRLVAALRRAGALDAPHLVLADLGWGGTIQLQLAQALRLAEVDVAVSGVYLATDQRAVRLTERGLESHGYLGRFGAPRDFVDTVVRSPEVVELAVNATCGSLLDFDETGAPVLGPAAPDDAQTQERRAVQEGVRAFQYRWNAYVRRSGGQWPSSTNEPIRARLREILRSALDTPTSSEASLFGAWSHEDNLGSDLSTALLPDELATVAPYLSVGDVDDLQMRDAFWPALVAAVDPRLAALVAATKIGRVTTGTVDGWAADGPEALLMVRTEDGEWRHGTTRPARINHCGQSYVRLAVRSGAVREDAERNGEEPVGSLRIMEVSIAPTGRSALVRVDWIQARIETLTGVVSTERWDDPVRLGGLPVADGTWLGGSLFEFRGARSALILPVGALAHGPIDRVEVSMGIGVLPQSAGGLTPPAPPATTGARIGARLREEYRNAGPLGVLSGAARLARRQWMDG